MEIHITPQTMKQPDLNIISLKINIHTLTFGKDATFMIELFSDSVDYFIDKPIIKYIKIEGQEYLNWGGGIEGDNYIINLICEKLNIKIK
jgi:hypothetical protein